MSALLTPIKTELLLTDEQVGRIELVFVLAYIVSAPIFGYLGDRYKRKWLILLALLIWSVASLGSGLAFALLPLLFWRSLVGAGEGAYQSIAPSWIADVFGPSIRNIAFSVFNSISKVGATIGVAVGGAIAASYSWHLAFIVAGAPGLLLAFAVLLAKEPRRGAADGMVAAISRPTITQSLGLLARGDYQIYLLGYTAYYIALSTLFYWGPAYMHRTFHLPNAVAAGYFGLGYTLMGLPGVFIGGYLGHLLQRRNRGGYAASLSLAMLLVTPVLVEVLLSTNLAWFRAGVFAEIFFFGLCSATVTTLVLETVPLALRSSAVAGGMVISSGLGGIFASEVVGILSDHFGLQRALFLAPTATIVGFAAWGWLALRQARKDCMQAVPLAPLSQTSVPGEVAVTADGISE
jgi:MFS family permease